MLEVGEWTLTMLFLLDCVIEKKLWQEAQVEKKKRNLILE
jgi:hypothetical protein